MPYLLDRPKIEFHRRPLLFIDMEFTGLDTAKHEIIEIAALLVSQPDLSIVNSYYTKVTPEHVRTADPKSLQVSGYLPKAWARAISLRQALIELSRFAPGCLLAGWSIQTEWDFLNFALEKEQLPYFYDHHLLEVYTLAFAKYFRLGKLNFLNLQSVARDLGIAIDRHKPDSEIRATYEIFKRLISS